MEANLFKFALCSLSLVNTTHLELDAMATASKSGRPGPQIQAQFDIYPYQLCIHTPLPTEAQQQ